ncbi:MAG TPA: tRNA (adenosine(37)-N6)-dimethylallyltransferase MiaA [Alphaproteobacteria bacterium]|jgi:tRNA dimethylallyltransferase|nr:tRNA (adenosine(37)-N6)-dimethylallyltransferase MiaA [Alphaproteobacteria bacterium]
MQKLLVICGPTATGKSDLAVFLAKKFDGEIISADSRQVYRDLNIGTGKITKSEMQGVPHYLLDVISPKKTFSVAEWQKQTQEKIEDILSRGKLPILCGGTGFYIKSIVDNITLPAILPNKKLRQELEKKSLSELVAMLKKLDPEKLKTIDQKNPVRLIRAIEIAGVVGKVPALKKRQTIYDVLEIGLKLSKEKLEEKIYNRLIKRLEIGMIDEAKNLKKSGLSYKRMESLGLEYRYLARYLQNKLTKEEFVNQLNIKIRQYAKRQMTWFKKDKRIVWFDVSQPRYIEKVEKLTKKWFNTKYAKKN